MKFAIIAVLTFTSMAAAQENFRVYTVPPVNLCQEQNSFCKKTDSADSLLRVNMLSVKYRQPALYGIAADKFSEKDFSTSKPKNWWNSPRRKWSKNDTILEAMSLALIAVDWGQTRNIAKNPQRWRESWNSTILGQHPSLGTVNLNCAVILVAHPIIARILPKKPRRIFQFITIGVEAGAVSNNFEHGINPTF